MRSACARRSDVGSDYLSALRRDGTHLLRAAVACVAGKRGRPAVLERPVLRGPDRRQRAAGGRQAGPARSGPFAYPPVRDAGCAGAAHLRAGVGRRPMSDLTTFLSGAISLACAVVALFFLRFWRSTHDTFFILFALSFALEAVGRGASAFLQLP